MKKLLLILMPIFGFAQYSETVNWLNENTTTTIRTDNGYGGYLCTPHFSDSGIYGLGKNKTAGFNWEDIDWMCYTDKGRIYLASDTRAKGWFEYITPKKGVEISDVMFHLYSARWDATGKKTFRNCGNNILKDTDEDYDPNDL